MGTNDEIVCYTFFSVYFSHWFKSKILSWLSYENTQKDKDYSNTNRIDRYWYLPRNKRPKYPEFSDYDKAIRLRYSEDSRNISNHFGYSNSLNSIARSVRFFIEEEQRHYRLLKTYVFQPLSEISRLYPYTVAFLYAKTEILSNR